MEEIKVGCGRPTGRKVGELEPESPQGVLRTGKEPETMETAKVGKKAPDFVAPAYHNGKFVQVRLSDYLGKWVVLCFYPANFTFV